MRRSWLRVACDAARARLLAGVASIVALGGCQAGPVAELVPLLGCGLEGEELGALRIRPRGDFPNPETVLVTGRTETLEALPSGTVALTVEGLVGEGVEAVGRTARLVEHGSMPVYFSPPDQLCAVPTGVAPREVGAIAVDGLGNVLLVGGRTPEGQLLDDVVHYADTPSVATPVDAHLPVPAVGQTLHAIGDGQFVVIGGAGQNALALREIIVFDVVDPPTLVARREPVAVDVPGQADPGCAHHGSVALPDASILVAGGCTQSQDGACVMGSAVATGFFVRRRDDGTFAFAAAPPLAAARYGHELLVARDGVAFATGGYGNAGAPLRTTERYVPGQGVWTSFGPAIGAWAAPSTSITGATLLEGGLVVLTMSDGRIGWVSEADTGELSGWCDANLADAPCFAGRAGAPDEEPALHAPQGLLALPGERVLADAFLVPVGSLAQDGTDAIDLAQASPGQPSPPPPQRTAARSVVLADGSVLMAGGRDPVDSVAAQPFLLRLRPALDGPDEQIPDVARIEPGSFIVHGPGAVTADAGRLVLSPGGETLQSPATWAHVRGFRSDKFRLEATLESDAGGRATLMLSAGAVTQVAVQLEDDRIRWIKRDRDAELDVACAGDGVDLVAARTLRFDVLPDGITISEGAAVVARCPAAGPGPFAVGLGASGAEVRVSGIRLSRR